MKKTIFGGLLFFAMIRPICSAIPTGDLGSGYYNSYNVLATGYTCLKPLQHIYGGSTSAILFRSIDPLDLMQDLGNASATYGTVPFSTDAAVDFERSPAETDYTQNFYYQAAIIMPALVTTMPSTFGTSNLNAFGAAALAKGPAQFLQSCGDRFLSQISKGEQIYIGMKFQFDTIQDKQNFNIYIASEFGFAPISAEIQNLFSSLQIKGNLQLSVLQIGGNAEKLATIFGKDSGEAGYTAASCQLSNLAQCNNAINAILNYVWRDFPTQVTWDAQNKKILGNAVKLTMPDYQTYTEYKLLGIFTPSQPIPSPETLQAQGVLNDALNQQKENQTVVDNLLHSPYSVFYTYNSKKQLEEAQAALAHNISLLQDSQNGAINCYLQSDKCIALSKQLINQLKPIDQKFLDQFAYAYAIDAPNLFPKTTNNTLIPLGENTYMNIGSCSGCSGNSKSIIKIFKNNTDTQMFLLLANGDVLGEPYFTATLNQTSAYEYIGQGTYGGSSGFQSIKLTPVYNPENTPANTKGK